jgi:hypothetical protein
MTQRNNHSRSTMHAAVAKPQGFAGALRTRLIIPLATIALITVLVLITGPLSAEYGFV